MEDHLTVPPALSRRLQRDNRQEDLGDTTVAVPGGSKGDLKNQLSHANQQQNIPHIIIHSPPEYIYMENKNDELQETATNSRETPGPEESRGDTSGQLLPQSNQLQSIPNIIIYSPSEYSDMEEKNNEEQEKVNDSSDTIGHEGLVQKK